MRTFDRVPLFLVAFGVAVAACNKDKKDSGQARDVSLGVPSAAAPEVLLPAPGAQKPGATQRLTVGVEWSDPPSWKRLPHSSPMRAATYQVPAADAATGQGELAVFYFGPGQGGAVEGNVERWAQQFGKQASEVERSNREVNGLKQHVVEIKKGDYSADRMGQRAAGQNKLKDWSMLAAIVEAPSGSYFFKLTGPEKLVAAERKVFFELLDSIKSRQ